jgi:hypothetical protein
MKKTYTTTSCSQCISVYVYKCINVPCWALIRNDIEFSPTRKRANPRKYYISHAVNGTKHSNFPGLVFYFGILFLYFSPNINNSLVIYISSLKWFSDIFFCNDILVRTFTPCPPPPSKKDIVVFHWSLTLIFTHCIN